MNITGKFLKVWKVKENNGYVKLDLGDSIKQKDGTYQNWTWFDCMLFGEAGKKEFHEGDTIEITSGLIYQEKYNEKWYTRLKIFHCHAIGSDGARLDDRPAEPPVSQFGSVEKKAVPQFTPGGSDSSFSSGGSFTDDIPF